MLYQLSYFRNMSILKQILINKIIYQDLYPERDLNPHDCNSQRILSPSCLPFHHSSILSKRAENETRTRDPNLGKVMLYQLSYFRRFLENGCKDKQFLRYSQTFHRKKVNRNLVTMSLLVFINRAIIGSKIRLIFN